MDSCDVAVIGGGASGYTAAASLAESGLSVRLFEADTPLAKVRLSGNGRCNFTNLHMDATHYTGGSMAFVAPILRDFGAQEAVDFFRFLGMPTRTLESGMTYPYTMQAQSVVTCLQTWADECGVRVHCPLRVERIRSAANGGFMLETPEGSFHAVRVVVATGGAYNARQQFSAAYALVKPFGHRLTPLHPGIVAVQTDEASGWQAMRGLKRHARVRFREKEAVGDVLVTDYGLSGLAVFRLSNDLLQAVREEGRVAFSIDWCPEMPADALADFLVSLRKAHPHRTRRTWLLGSLGPALSEMILRRARQEVQKKPWDLSWGDGLPQLEDVQAVVSSLKNCMVHTTGARKKDRGQVTCGGLSTAQVSAQTLESKLCPGLYLIGEVLDVQGECGGYNLHWAWASAYRVARVIAGKRRETCFK